MRHRYSVHYVATFEPPAPKFMMSLFGGSPLNLLLRINAHVTQALHNVLIYLPYTSRCTDLHHLALLLKVVHYGHARLDKSFESLLNTLLIIVTPPTCLSSVQ